MIERSTLMLKFARKTPVIKDSELTLKLLKYKNEKQWNLLRQENAEWLSPWEGTRPTLPASMGKVPPVPTFYGMVSNYKKEAKALRNISCGIFLTQEHSSCNKYYGKPELIGQITLGGIVFGALHGAHIGYWIDEKHSGRGYMTRSVNAITHYAFNVLGLHRIEINIRPENESSLKVAQNAGYLYEGDRPKFLHIDSQWRDHKVFVKVNPNIL